MVKTLQTTLLQWHETYDTRQKLQHGYAAAGIFLVLGAGIVGLINYDLGQRMLLGAFVCFAVFILNAIAWALLQSFVLMPLEAKRSTANKPTTAKSTKSSSTTTRKK